VFDKFESLMLPIIARHHRRLLLRIRPGPGAYLVSDIRQPYEIHLVEVDAEEDFLAFMKDEKRKTFLHLKKQSIESDMLVKGIRR